MAQPSLWITYAWTDDKDGDFSFLVQELRTVGIDARFDRITLIPGQRLWQQLGDRITKDPLDGWAYLITPNSLESEPCREELAYALDRALHTKGADFPLIGLLHGGVRFEDVPPALRVRLCVSLANPSWKEQVLAGLQRRAPQEPAKAQTRYVWSAHRGYAGNPNATAIEVRPRFGEVNYWRFLVPKGTKILEWGWGPSGGGEVSGNKMSSVDGFEGELEGEQVTYFGCGNVLSPNRSAYVLLEHPLPSFVAFGLAREEYGPPTEAEKFKIA